MVNRRYSADHAGSVSVFALADLEFGRGGANHLLASYHPHKPPPSRPDLCQLSVGSPISAPSQSLILVVLDLSMRQSSVGELPPSSHLHP
jgi:hypothetical protein